MKTIIYNKLPLFQRQLQGLEEAYSRSQYLDRESRLELCKKLSLSLHTVVYWFQNKRAISRRRGQPLDTPNSSTVDSLHVYPTDHSKNSPPFKPCSPPSPSQFVSANFRLPLSIISDYHLALHYITT